MSEQEIKQIIAKIKNIIKEQEAALNSAQSEIQQLKKDLSKEQHYKSEWKHQFLKIAKQNIEFAKQVEAAKKVIKKICSDCGEKDYPPHQCENDCDIYELEKVLESAQNSGGK